MRGICAPTLKCTTRMPWHFFSMFLCSFRGLRIAYTHLLLFYCHISSSYAVRIAILDPNNWFRTDLCVNLCGTRPKATLYSLNNTCCTLFSMMLGMEWDLPRLHTRFKVWIEFSHCASNWKWKCHVHCLCQVVDRINCNNSQHSLHSNPNKKKTNFFFHTRARGANVRDFSTIQTENMCDQRTNANIHQSHNSSRLSSKCI